MQPNQYNVLGRNFRDYEMARYFAAFSARNNKRDVALMARDDDMSPAYVLEWHRAEDAHHAPRY